MEDSLRAIRRIERFTLSDPAESVHNASVSPTAPPLPPPVPSPVAPSSGGTFVVELPPEVIETFKPAAESGLTQPIATIVAAIIALTAAGIAYLGIRAQVKGSQRESEKTRSAETARARRSERVQLISDSLDAARQSLRAAQLFFQNRKNMRTTPRANVSGDVIRRPREELDAAIAKSALARDMLEIHDFTKQAEAMDHLNETLRAAADNNEQKARIDDAWSRLLQAFRMSNE